VVDTVDVYLITCCPRCGRKEVLSLFLFVREALRPTLRELHNRMKVENSKRQPVDLGPALLKCVVGYLGTIEMSVESGQYIILWPRAPEDTHWMSWEI
jgi:hypothetical protein